MSAGICILNRNAIAMAADSAVTVGDHVAIHNSANKLFSLSKVAPVGMIIYANADLMNVPIEIIVKEYKKQNGLRTFDHLYEYVDDFLVFLEDNAELFRFPTNEESFVMDIFVNWTRGLLGDKKNAIEKRQTELGREDLTNEELAMAYQEAVETSIAFVDTRELLPNKVFKQHIENKYKDKFSQILKNTKDFQWMTEEQIEKITQKACDLYDTKFDRNGYVGIAIAGYGEKDVFPELHHIHVTGWINGNLRRYTKEKTEIDEDKTASIVPLAQTDVMQTFLFGINDRFLDDLAAEIPKEIIDCFQTLDDNCFAPGQKDMVQEKLISVTGGIVNHMIETAGKDYMRPIIQSVATLPVEELALLAESMINITSLRRKVAIDQNIGTVGGPIDVAIISKGDGFIWLKRKHYFEGKYNPQYFFSHFFKRSEGET